ncbi:uncharacterized protein LOC141673918 [Apium graveolens]|uniref:uncharacterized protein LOC141673918 n=1 Tax=Apium graveolens TaxID=4045 RepID=UPI003D7ACCCE
MTGCKPSAWVAWLPLAEWWYNTSFHSSLGMTLFQALYSKPPPSNHYQYNKMKDHAVNNLLEERAATQLLLKDNLSKDQERMKCYANKKSTDREFNVNDEVFLKLQPYRHQSLATRRNHKLSAKYYGPYHITEWIGRIAYKLTLPPGAKLHNVFHVSQLKKKIGNHKLVQVDLRGINDQGSLNPQPIAILDRRFIKRHNKPATMVIFKWENGTDEEATWKLW